MFDNLRIYICDRLCKDDVRVVFRIGKVIEQSWPVAKTIKFFASSHNPKEYLIMAFELTDNQQTTVSVKFVTKRGNPAPVDGIPVWSTDNSDVLAIEPAVDGMSCVVKAVGPLGMGNITLKADADMGSGVVDVFGALEVRVSAGNAAVVALDAAPPTEQP